MSSSVVATLKTIVGFLVARRDYIILTSLYLFHVITTGIWLKLDNTPLPWDSGEHYLKSLQLHDIFGFDSFLDVLNPLWLRHIPEAARAFWEPFWLPFSQALVTPFYTIFGREPDTAVLIQCGIFYFILIFSVYGIGKRLFSRNAGLLAAFMTTMYPFVINPMWQQKVFALDIPLAAMVSLSLYTLLLTEHFTKIKYSILFGITLGLGWLTKFPFPLFVIGPIGLIAITSVMEMVKGKEVVRSIRRFKGRIPNMVYSLIAFALVATDYYVVNSYIFAFSIENARAWALGGPLIFHLIEGTALPFFILAVIALLYVVYLVISKSLRFKGVIFLLLWFVIPYVMFTISVNHHTRYLTPLLPAVALISAVALLKIRFNKLKAALIFLVIILGLVQFSAFSFGAPDLPEVRVTVASYTFRLSAGRGEPRQVDCKALDIVEIIKEDWDSLGIPEDLMNSEGPLPDEISIISYYYRLIVPIKYYSYLHGLPLFVDIEFGVRGEEARFDKSLYVLTYEGNEGFAGYYPHEKEACQRMYQFLQDHIDDYELVGEVELPDGSNLLIYRSKKFAEILGSGLGRLWEPDTDMVAITSIHPDKPSYDPIERMTVAIGLKNIDNIPHDGKVWWQLMRPESEWDAQPVAWSESKAVIILNAGEEREVLLTGSIPPQPGSYELRVWAHVFTTEQQDETAHSDDAYYRDRIEITGEAGEGSGLGRGWEPDTDMLVLTSINPDKHYYLPDERITVAIGIKNVADVPYEGNIFWHLKPPESEMWRDPIATSSQDITVDAGQETKVFLDATIPQASGSYELTLGVRVFTTEEQDETIGSDSAYHSEMINIGMTNVGEGILGLPLWAWIVICTAVLILAVFVVRRYA